MDNIPPSVSEDDLTSIGSQLLVTWQAHDPEQRYAQVLDNLIEHVETLFAGQIVLTTIYIYRETELLYLERSSGHLHTFIRTNTAHPQGAAAQMVLRKQPLFVEDITKWPIDIAPLPQQLIDAGPIRAHISLPLLIGLKTEEEVIGTILISLNQSQNFTPSLQRDLWYWAQKTAILVQNARVFRRRRLEEQAFATISNSATTGEPDEVATVIAHQIRALTKSAHVVVLTVNHQQELLESCGVAIFGEQRLRDVIQLSLKQPSINTYVFHSRQSHYAPNVSIDPYYLNYQGWDDGMRAAFCVPLLVQGQCIGTIYITSKEVDGIARQDRHFVEAFASHAAIALQHAEHIATERHQREVQAGQVDLLQKIRKFQAEITDVLTFYDQARQIRFALGSIGINTDGLFIATYRVESNEISFPKVRVHGRRIEECEKTEGSLYGPRPLQEQRSVVDYVLQTGNTLLIENCDAWLKDKQVEPLYLEGVYCLLIVPLYHGGKLVGVIGLRGYERPYTLSTNEQLILEAIADDIATVIDNAQKYESVLVQLNKSNEELRQRIRELRAVSDFQQSISTIDIPEGGTIQGADIVDLDPETTAINVEERELQNIYTQAREAMRGIGLKTESMLIALYNEHTKVITFPLIYEIQERVTDKARLAYRRRHIGEYPHLIEWVIEHRQSLLFSNRNELERWFQEHNRHFQIPEQSCSWLGAPMIARNKLIGVLVVRDFEQESVFHEPHRQLLQTIAGQAAIVIDNARLYERSHRAVRQLQALYHAGQSISAAGIALDDVLQAILVQAIKVTGAYFATIRLLKDKELQLVAVWPPDKRLLVQQLLPALSVDGPGVIPQAFRNNRYQLVTDVAENVNFVDLMGETNAEMAVVLRLNRTDSHSEPIGVLNVEHREVGGITKEDHAGILVGLANLAALAIRNADQASELEEARNYAIINEAIAWMGIFAAESQHTMAQKIISMRYCLDTLREWGSTLVPTQRDFLNEVVDDLGKITNEIHSIRPTTAADVSVDVPTNVDLDLRRTTQAWCDEYNRKHGAEILYQFDLHCPGIFIQVPARILHIATEKVVHNALKAMKSRGMLTLRSWCRDEYVNIEIQDTGPGIPHFARNDFLKRPIARSHSESQQGSGMGAHMARIVARRYGGDLELAETSKSGTTLRLTFPVYGKHQDAQDSSGFFTPS